MSVVVEGFWWGVGFTFGVFTTVCFICVIAFALAIVIGGLSDRLG